ncbi:MAG: TRAP transporter fused permease subunit [Deltaproteobacteria bacterium]|nr:TRAP transporter fused permease subunit [Deltaproteobacteria bacterium]
METPQKHQKYLALKRHIVEVLGISLSLFIIFTIVRGQYSVPVQRGTVLMLGAVMIFLSRRTLARSSLFWLDEIISWSGIVAMIGCVLYMYVEWFDISQYRQGIPNRADLVVYVVTILVVFEITRRASDLSIPVVALVSILYLLLGPYLPWIFRHSSVDIVEILEGSFGMTGIYGLVLSVMAGIIYIFLIYGAFLRVSGAGDVFVKIAYMTAGRLRGGAAQTAVLSSTLFGSISGSAPANVVATGNFTIPMMIKVGYKPVYAGAVEACSSTVGQIMPPVMGVTAFIMSEITGIPYLRICLGSMLPAILFSISLLILVYLEAKKSDIALIPREEIPVVTKAFIRQAAILGFSLGTLVFMLIRGHSPAFSCVLGILTLIIGSLFDKTMRMTPKKILVALSQGAQDGLALLAICAILGIVINAIASTGIGLQFSQIITSLAKGNLLAALIITMFSAIVLGLGLPTVPTYLLAVLVVGPALSKLGIPLLLAHLFVFYYGVMETLTPPVCMSAYTAASISKANPMLTGFVAWRFGLVGFMIPFIMVYNPEISFFAESYLTVLVVFLLSAVGVLAWVAAERGFLLHHLSMPSRALLLLIALSLFYPLYWAKIVGLCAFTGMIYFSFMTMRRRALRYGPENPG